MKPFISRRTAAVVAALGLGAVACGSDSSDDDTSSASDTPTIVVTTNVLGDVVEQIVGTSAEVVTIMPVGADPHDFQASAQEVDTLNSADALIVNGADFEEGLLDVIEGAEGEGVPTYEAISAVDTIEFGEGDDHHGDDGEHSDDEQHDDDGEHSDEEHAEEDDEHSDEEHSDEGHDDHDHEGVDPHFFTDPMRMAAAVDGIVDFLQDELDLADPDALNASAAAYVADLTELDDAVAGLVGSIPEERRILVTSHEVFGYFADRYGFEIVGVVVPGGTTTDSVSAGELAELADVVEAEGVPAIFADTSSSNDVVDALADEVGDIAVVDLYTESLGEADGDGATYLAMIRTNAERISDALA